MKVDCITVNCEPVKNVIDDLIQRLFDILLSSLRKSIQGKDGTLIVHSFLISVDVHMTNIHFDWKVYMKGKLKDGTDKY